MWRGVWKYARYLRRRAKASAQVKFTRWSGVTKPVTLGLISGPDFCKSLLGSESGSAGRDRKYHLLITLSYSSGWGASTATFFRLRWQRRARPKYYFGSEWQAAQQTYMSVCPCVGGTLRSRSLLRTHIIKHKRGTNGCLSPGFPTHSFPGSSANEFEAGWLRKTLPTQSAFLQICLAVLKLSSWAVCKTWRDLSPASWDRVLGYGLWDTGYGLWVTGYISRATGANGGKGLKNS